MNTEQLTLQIRRATPLSACLDAFLLDREVARCTPKTLTHYRLHCWRFRRMAG
jgi:hypothetical protein